MGSPLRGALSKEPSPSVEIIRTPLSQLPYPNGSLFLEKETNAMNTQTSLADLQPGQTFGPILLAVRSVIDRGTETRSPQLTAVVMDATQPEGRTAKVWQADATTRAVFQAGKVVFCWGKVDATGPWSGELTVEKVETTKTPVDPSAFLPARPKTATQDWQEFKRAVGSLQNPFLVALLKSLFPRETQTAFADAVAAQTHHHAYRGGLLQHTMEVVRLCEAACTVFPFLNRELLITGALLHDFGKLTEMEHGLRAGMFTTEGTLVGHLAGGAFQVWEAAKQIKDFPQPLLLALVHLILSHHGEQSHGSPKAPAFPEALVLSLCDRMSAHATAMHTTLQRAPVGQESIRHGNAWLVVNNFATASCAPKEMLASPREETH